LFKKPLKLYDKPLILQQFFFLHSFLYTVTGINRIVYTALFLLIFG